MNKNINFTFLALMPLFSIIILNFLSIYNININKYLKIFILLLSTLCAVYSIYKKSNIFILLINIEFLKRSCHTKY